MTVDRERRLEELVIDLWRTYQCEEDCRVCEFFYLEDQDDPLSNGCRIEDRMDELGVER